MHTTRLLHLRLVPIPLQIAATARVDPTFWRTVNLSSLPFAHTALMLLQGGGVLRGSRGSGPGADAAAKSKDGTAPLYGASLRSHVDLAQLLIEHGADAAQSKDSAALCVRTGSYRLALYRALPRHGSPYATGLAAKSPTQHDTSDGFEHMIWPG